MSFIMITTHEKDVVPHEWQYGSGVSPEDDSQYCRFRHCHNRLQILDRFFFESAVGSSEGLEVEFIMGEEAVEFIRTHEDCAISVDTQVDADEDYTETKAHINGYRDIDYAMLPAYLERQTTLFPDTQSLK